MNEDWQTLRVKLRRIVLRLGATVVASEIPAERSTVYRLIDGDTRRPSRAVRAGIERIVATHGTDTLRP